MSGNKHILAVDDEILNLDIIEHVLKKAGYKVTCVEDGSKAMIILSTDPDAYDVVLLDRMMPVMNGLEVVEQMKGDEKLKNIPIIMQTAASNTKQVEEGLQAGVFDYITKPYGKPELLDSIDKAIKSVT